MGAKLTKGHGRPPALEELEEALLRQGLQPTRWRNDPGYRYGQHEHRYHKVLYCGSGSITFHTDQGDFHLEPGDCLEVEPGTPHSATVGPQGVECVEGAR
jgi:quercetin dioxygenase-like cupin family protein